MKIAQRFLVELFENPTGVWARMFRWLIVFLILGSIGLFVLENYPELQRFRGIFQIIDTTILVIFALEYVLRILAARKPLQFIFSPLGIIDFLVILPIFYGFSNLIFLRGFRLMEMLRILKIIRYSELMRNFFRSFRHYREEIRIFGLTAVVVLTLSSLGIFSLEKDINPAFESIDGAIWWSVVTMSTVGYGDIVPITIAGKILAVIVILLGLATIAIMTAILTKIFIDHFFGKHYHNCEFCHFPHHDRDAKFCKNCGNQLDTEKLQASAIAHVQIGSGYGESRPRIQ